MNDGIIDHLSSQMTSEVSELPRSDAAYKGQKLTKAPLTTTIQIHVLMDHLHYRLISEVSLRMCNADI